MCYDDTVIGSRKLIGKHLNNSYNKGFPYFVHSIVNNTDWQLCHLTQSTEIVSLIS